MGGPLKFKFANHFIIYQKRPLRELLGLAGYTQSSGTGELSWKASYINSTSLIDLSNFNNSFPTSFIISKLI